MPDFSPFSFIKNDKIVGFENDLLQIISKKTGIKFEKQFSSWNKNLKKFKEKKVDIITSISHKKSREAFSVFTTAYYEIPIMIFVRDDFGKYEGMQSLESKKVGILKDIFYEKELKEYINTELHIYETYEELTDALVFGKIDALVQNLPNIHYLIKKNIYSNLLLADELSLLGIKKEDLRFGINPNKPLLHSIIQKVLDSIDEKRWETLSDKWLSVKLIGNGLIKKKNKSIAILSKEERDYLQNNIIQIGMIKDYYPFSYEENGKINGFSYEYFKLLASKVDMNFDIQIDNWSSSLDKFKNKKIDIIDAISYTKEREEFTNFSSPYFQIPNAIFARKNSFKDYKGLESLKGKRVGITEKIYYFDIIKKLDLFELVVFKSSRQKIKALALGKIDAAFNNLTSGQKYILQGGYTNLQVLDEINDALVKKEDLRLGVSKDNEILYSIIKKATNKITINEKLKLANKYFGVGFKKEKKITLTDKEKLFLKNHSTITLGTAKNWEPLSIEDNDGTISGYDQDVLDKVNKATGANFILYRGNWANMQALVEKKELDGLTNLIKTTSRENFLNFSTPYTKLRKMVVVKNTNPLNIQSFKDLEGKTIVIHRKNAVDENLAKQIKNIKIIRVETPLDMLKELIYGKADATFGSILTQYLLSKEGLPYVTNAFEIDEPLDLRFALRNDWPEAMSIFQKGLDSIHESEKTALYEKWFSDFHNKKIQLTLKENKYLNNKQNIKMCAIPNMLPLEQIGENGNHKGIADDIIQIVSKGINKSFVLVPTKSWSESLENIKNKKCDILPAAMKTQSRQKHMNFTAPYIVETLVVATKDDKFFIKDSSELKDKKIGIVESYAFIELLKEKHPNIDIVYVKDAKDGLEKVKDGELFGYVDILPSIAYTIQNEGLFDLKVAGKLEFDVKFSVASRRDEPLLNSIIEKALKEIRQKEIRSIVGKWVTIKVEQSFDYRKLLYISLFFLSILAVVIYKNRSIKSLNTKLEKLSITDNLTKLYNRNKIEEVLEVEVNRANRFETNFSIIMIDIDYFKRVNDICGHQMGDTVLKEFANILKSSLRKTDTVARWGGEEFIIICSETDIKGATSFANNIRKNISNYAFSIDEQKTASFGIAMYEKNEDINALIKRVDDALYKAKENGRNRIEVL